MLKLPRLRDYVVGEHRYPAFLEEISPDCHDVRRFSFNGRTSVYQAWIRVETGSQVPVAIKVTDEGKDAQLSLASTKGELLLMNRVYGASRNLVPRPYGLGKYEGKYCLITGWVEATDLETHLTSIHSNTDGYVNYIKDHKMESLCGSYIYVVRSLRRLGIAHRDLSPGNILILGGLSAMPRVMIVDFGISGYKGNLVTASGTPGIMAPETVLRSYATESPPIMTTARLEEDLFALGVLIFYTLSGKAPFSMESPTDFVNDYFDSAKQIALLRDSPVNKLYQMGIDPFRIQQLAKWETTARHLMSRAPEARLKGDFFARSLGFF